MALHRRHLCVTSVAVLLLCVTSGATLTGTGKYAYTWWGKPWESANSCCRMRNMELVTIDSAEKMRAASQFASKYYDVNFWIGLRAENVSDVTTYSWSDGTPYDVSVPFDMTSLDNMTVSGGPACFQMDPDDGTVLARPCSEKAWAMLCDLKDGFERVVQKYNDGCPAWNTFIKEENSTGLAAQSVRWRLGWESGLTVELFSSAWSKFAPIAEDCFFTCQKRSPPFRGVQTESGQDGVVRCTCLK